MNDNQACEALRPMDIGQIAIKEPAMNLKTHKRLTDLAYRVKDFIDGNGGLTYQESCVFGQIITGIINLK